MPGVESNVINFDRGRLTGVVSKVAELHAKYLFDPSQFWAIIDTLPIAVLIATDRDCTQIEGNVAARVMLRCAPGQNLSKSAPRMELPPFDVYADGRHLAPEELPMQRAAATGKPAPRSECEVRFEDGSHAVLSGHSVPLFDRNGDPCGSIGVFVDITNVKALEEQNQRLRDKLAIKSRREALLFEAVRVIIAEGEGKGDLSRRILEIIGPGLGIDICFDYRYDPAARRLQLLSGPGLPQDLRPFFETLEMGEAYCGLVAATGNPFAADADLIASDRRAALVRKAGVKAYVCHPLMDSTGQLLGTLSFGSFERTSFSADDIGFLQTVCQHVALVWESYRARSKANERERQLRLVTDAATVFIAHCDAGQRYRFVNPAYAQRFGLRPEDLIGRTIADVLGADSYAAIVPYIERCLAGETVEFEIEMPYASINPSFIRAYFVPERRERRVEGFVATVIDITDRRRAEESLRESEAQLRLAQTIGGFGSYDWDLKSNTATYSPEYIKLHGLPADKTSEGFESWRDRIYPEDRERAIRTVLEVFEKSSTTPLEYRIVRPSDGKVRWILERREVFYDNRGLPFRVVGAHQDITEQREAEAALRESERRFRQVTESLPQLIWTCAGDGYCDYLSPQWVRFTGKSEAEQLGYGWQDAVHADDRDRARAQWQASVVSGGEYDIEYRLRFHDGTYRWTRAIGLPLRNAQGEVIKWFGSNTDIQAVVEAREVLARSREDLERLVEERTRDLQAAHLHVAHLQRMDALGKLADGIAHDFNNILQAVDGGIRMMKRRAQDRSHIEHISALVLESTARGAAITRRLLTFSRQGELRCEAIAVRGLLNNLREILLHSLGAGIRIVVEADDADLQVFADKGQLETVLINLATNARDAMDGQGKLTVSASSAQLLGGRTLSHSIDLKPGRYVIFKMMDTGAGMPPEVLSKVTEPFFTTKPAGKGTGLGLAMARGFAEQSGGGLQIESAVGRGTSVSLWFPEAESDEKAGDRTMPEISKPARILLLDDEPLILKGLTDQLQSHGCEVISFSNAASALAALEAGVKTDLIITDVSMPGIDGMAFLQAARRLVPAVPVIVLTGYADMEPTFGSKSQATVVLRKPLAEEALLAEVAKALKGASQKE
jgi:PAS domain S-box-containing protein